MKHAPLPTPLAGLIDTHCHLSSKYTNKGALGAQAQLNRARQVGVKAFLVIGVGDTIEEAHTAISIAQSEPDVRAAVGIHPHDALHSEAQIDQMSHLVEQKEVVAIGEMGLDFHYDFSPRDLQRDSFRKQIALARKVKKPIVVHTRSAGMETIEILREEKAMDVGGIIHCFSEDLPFAKEAIELGFYLSFSGIVTFKSSETIRKVAEWCPKDRILVETDAPYLSPVPVRGCLCEPALVVHTARCLAVLRRESESEFAENTSNNVAKLFPEFQSLNKRNPD